MAEICVLGYTHPVNDKRVFRTVASLAKKHKVYYVYQSDETQLHIERELKREYPEVEFVGIALERADFKAPIKRIKRRFKFDRKILRAFREMIQRIDLVYIHGNWLATYPMEPFCLAQRFDKRIIYDVHEYYPESVFERLPRFLLPAKRALVRSLLSRQLSIVDGVVWVSHAQKRLYKVDLTLPSTIIPNVAMFFCDTFSRSQRESAFIIAGKTPKDVSGASSLVRMIRSRGLKVKLWLVGGLAGQSSSDYCEIFPFLPYEDMMKLLQKSLYSLMVFRTYRIPSLNDRASLPHKFFDSLAAGTPVIVDEFFEEMARLTRKWGVGLVVDMRNPEAAANKIISSLEDGSYENFLRNIDRHKTKFTWQAYEQHFLRFVDAVLEGRA